VKELVERTIARAILWQQIFYDDLGDDGLTWAFSPSGTYALSVHSGSVPAVARCLPLTSAHLEPGFSTRKLAAAASQPASLQTPLAARRVLYREGYRHR